MAYYALIVDNTAHYNTNPGGLKSLLFNGLLMLPNIQPDNVS